MSDNQTTSSHINAILEQTPNGILLVDSETSIHFVNPAFRRMFHCESEELLGQRAGQFVPCDCFERPIKGGGNKIAVGKAHVSI